jgi:hypothetical protein
MLKKLSLFSILFAVASTTPAIAQQGYEFEVYGADIGPIGSTELELNTNFVADGVRNTEVGHVSSRRAVRSSLELSRTLNTWLRGSVYLTTFSGDGRPLSYVGNRAKITVAAPMSWGLPFDFAVANEVTYARPRFSENEWSYELTPIVEKNFGSLSLTFNPAIERGLGNNSEREIEIEPRGKIAYAFGDEAKVALEYYAGLGAINEKYPVREQRHQIFARILGEVAPKVDLGLGVGRGLTPASDRWVIAAVLEYEFRD